MSIASESRPLQAAGLAAIPASSPIGRREVVDRMRRVVGYELFLRNPDPEIPSPNAALFAALTQEGHASLAGRKLVLVHCTDSALADDSLAQMPADGVVLVFTPPAALTAADIEARTLQLVALRQRGFALAFSHMVLARPLAAWLPLASFITIDITTLQPAMLAPLVQKVRQLPNARLLARNVDAIDDYTRLSELGVHFFQGDWFNQPVPVKARAIRPSQATILQLINLLRSDAELPAIEELLKRDATLSFNLLRFINSSGFGLSCEITSFRHAAMIIGQKNLFRWAALLLTASRDSPAPPAIGNTAIVRGRLTELLAAELLTPEDCDNAFIVGVFSLLDVMLGVPMAQSLHQLPLPESVTDALLYRTGPFAPFLKLTIACERGEDEGFAQTARALHLSNHQINWAHLQALAWADTLLD